MTCRTHLALAAAAALALGSFSIAQQRDTGAGAAPAAPTAGAGAQSQQQGGAAEQQAIQQFQQIAQDPNTAADKLFVVCAAHESLMCQQVSQQVAAKAQNNDVKQLAQQHVQDEQQTQQRLQTLAQSLQVQLPRQISPVEQQIIQVFSSIPADQLEKHFVSGVNAESAKNIVALQSCAQLSQNDAIKRFAQEQLATAQQQRQQAIAAAQKLGIPTGEAIPAGAKIAPDSATPPARSDTPGAGTNR